MSSAIEQLYRNQLYNEKEEGDMFSDFSVPRSISRGHVPTTTTTAALSSSQQQQRGSSSYFSENDVKGRRESNTNTPHDTTTNTRNNGKYEDNGHFSSWRDRSKEGGAPTTTLRELQEEVTSHNGLSMMSIKRSPPRHHVAQPTNYDFETLFTLVSSDVGGGQQQPAITLSSLEQFLRTVQFTVDQEALEDMFLVGGGGRGGGRRGGNKGVLAKEDAEVLFREHLSHWAPVLLSRCDTLANVAEASHELDVLTDEIRLKSKCLNDLEHDRHSLQREIHFTKTSSNLPLPRRHVSDAVQDPSLSTALTNQEEKYGAVSSQLKSALSEIETLTSKLANSNELLRMRSSDHHAAEEQFQSADKLLWDHNSDLVEIEREYVRAKERYEDAKRIQKKLFREKEAHEEAMLTAGRLFDDAEDMVRGVKKQKEVLQKDVEHRLQPEFDRLNKIVAELRVAISPPTQDDLERAAEKDLAMKLEAEADNVTSLINRCRSELKDISSQRDEYTHLLARHRAWLTGGKRDEDELLLQELEQCINRASSASFGYGINNRSSRSLDDWRSQRAF